MLEHFGAASETKSEADSSASPETEAFMEAIDMGLESSDADIDRDGGSGQGTLPKSLQTWVQLGPAIHQLPHEFMDVIAEAATTKQQAMQECKCQAKERHQEQWHSKQCTKREKCTADGSDGEGDDHDGDTSAEYM
ncbi:hypothetical protein F5J12DRAFT_783911 [Pisolithus orientalis]|uniref:uncharacterized protein n=1 Tax=Pisolithus orientalis TaxID=936130 RepID=UPI002224DCBF|nr:uncharacterized protein F5J12DRAFT_783911 [Pisolithus orientalis]KAI6002445.1 hypothetical protein F5J12DRAFT_783911 [Pisolithus orientalis]